MNDDDLRQENITLRARVEELTEALEKANRELDLRWQAIERLAPAAKRLRIERNRLRSELEKYDSLAEISDSRPPLE